MEKLQVTTKLIKDSRNFLPAIRQKNVVTIPTHYTLNKKPQAGVPSASISAQFAKLLRPSEKIAAKTFLTNRQTGQKIPVYVTKFERDDKIHLYIKNEQADKLGYAAMVFPYGGVFKKPIGNDYIYNSVELVSLESKNQARKSSPFRGIGTELLKAAVKESIANGYGGRIHLMAYNSKPPTIFYYKSGLKFLNNEKDKLMQKYLSTPAAQRGELQQNLQSGLMYLPKENIKKLLVL